MGAPIIDFVDDFLLNFFILTLLFKNKILKLHLIDFVIDDFDFVIAFD